jgi:hypothetical protein
MTMKDIYVVDNKVHKLATVCLPWQHWTKALVRFDNTDIAAFHSFVVVDLWQSLSEWHLLLSVCVLVCATRMSELVENVLTTVIYFKRLIIV